MSRPDEPRRRRPLDPIAAASATDPAEESDAGTGAAAPSKTRRKAAMHALQDLGEALVGLDPRRLAELAAEAELPERLVDAITQARTITAWGGRKRQMQYIGKLMRDVDPEPIRRRLDAWAHGHFADTARQHALEEWRDRLLAEPEALDALAARHPQLDRPRFRTLIARAREERASGSPPHAYRELFRVLKSLDGAPD